MSMSLDSSTNAEPGTVTAKAISSEDYYAEVRRELQQEAVVAVDVIPLAEDGRSGTTGINKRNSSNPSKSDQDRNLGLSHQKIRRKNVWICCGIGIVLTVLIGVLVPLMRRPGPGLVGAPPQTPTEAPYNELDTIMENTKNIMESEEGTFWRPKILDVFPKEALTRILEDPTYASPEYTAFVFLIENANTLFVRPADDESLSDLDASKVCAIFSLVTIYHSLGGEYWFNNKNNNWLKPEVDICEWQGVNCKGDLVPKQYPIARNASATTDNYRDPISITQVDLDNNTVSNWENAKMVVDDGATPLRDYEVDDDTVPIHNLNLKANNLTGSLPEEIGLLKNIQGLELSFNPRLIGTIPSSLGKLSKLEDLFLHGNNLESFLPTELGQMTNLRGFDVRDNKNINGRFPKELELWTKIEKLQIQGTSITGEVPYTFCDMIDNRAPLQVRPNSDGEFLFLAPCSLDCPCCTECRKL